MAEPEYSSQTPSSDLTTKARLDRKGSFPFVLAWSLPGFPLLQGTYCSGTKISDRHILTAAHCLTEVDSAGNVRLHSGTAAGSPLEYSLRSRVHGAVDIQVLTLKRVLIMPELERCFEAVGGQDEACSEDVPVPDVAVLEVEPGGSFASAPSIEIESRFQMAGAEIHVVGYGDGRGGQMGFLERSYHVAFIAQPRVMNEVVLDSTYPYPADDRMFFGSLGPLVADYASNLTEGDSGGAVLSRHGAGECKGHGGKCPWRIIGVNSYGLCPESLPECEVTSNSFFQRIDAESEHGVGPWLRAIIGPSQ